MVKVLFFGTPQIAVPFLDWLIKHTRVTGVVCRPDEPAGRGYKVTAPPTKILAEQNKIPVFQPAGLWTDDVIRSLSSTGADIGVIVAYGRILPRPVFSIPRLGCVNIHFSLLPKYRGAAPMQWALINGETKTGVSAFWLEEGLDSGPLFHQVEEPIEADDDIVSLREKLIQQGLRVLESVIKDVSEEKILRRPQQGEMIPAPILKKEHGTISWEKTAEDIVNLIKGVCEWPGAVTRYPSPTGEKKLLKIMKASLQPGPQGQAHGTIIDANRDGITVQAGKGAVELRELVPEGKKRMTAWNFWQGAHLKIGDRLG